MSVRDIDHGASALTRRLEKLSRSGVRVTVGIHEDTGAEQHPSGDSIAAVAAALEFGTSEQRPEAFVRGAVDEQRGALGAELARAGADVLEGTPVSAAFGVVGAQIATSMQSRVSTATGTTRASIEARVDGERVS